MSTADGAAPVPARELRSWLFVPADRERMIERGTQSEADAIILDLEDAVVQDRRPLARGLLSELLSEPPTGANQLWVRINPLDTSDALADLAAVVRVGLAGVVLPKIRSAVDVIRLDAALSALEAREAITAHSIDIMVVATETPEMMFRLGDLAGSSPRLRALTWGAEDLSTALGAATNVDDQGRWDRPYELAMSLCMFAAGACDAQAVDTLYADFSDDDGLLASTRLGARRGFTGKIAIHPRQVPVINAALTPSAEEIDDALAVINAFAANPGAGSVALHGRMLDRPHLVQAERLVGRAGRIGPS
jgi:citrate lyase subunit beta/citryl-CoA lyase